MKKQYITPAQRCVDIDSSTLICTSPESFGSVETEDNNEHLQDLKLFSGDDEGSYYNSESDELL